MYLSRYLLFITNNARCFISIVINVGIILGILIKDLRKDSLQYCCFESQSGRPTLITSSRVLLDPQFMDFLTNQIIEFCGVILQYFQTKI